MAVLLLAAAAILSLIIGVDGKTDKARTLIMKGRIPRESSDSGTPKDIKIRSLHSKHYILGISGFIITPTFLHCLGLLFSLRGRRHYYIYFDFKLVSEQ